MAHDFRYEDEFLELKSELRFISYAVEQTLSGLKDTSEREDVVHEIGYGFCLCFRQAMKRLERIEQQAVTDFLS